MKINEQIALQRQFNEQIAAKKREALLIAAQAGVLPEAPKKRKPKAQPYPDTLTG
jgi:hypothetical protein